MKPPVVLSENLSTLLETRQSSSEDKEFGSEAPSEGVGEVPSTGLGSSRQEGVKYVSFRFRPDGSTDLPGGKPGKREIWYLTLVKEDVEEDSTPDNYFTIQVQPFSGKISVFRP